MIKVMTFLAPSLLANIDIMMLDSSLSVSAQKTSVFSMFSCFNSKGSLPLPCNTMVFSNMSESVRHRS